MGSQSTQFKKGQARPVLRHETLCATCLYSVGWGIVRIGEHLLPGRGGKGGSKGTIRRWLKKQGVYEAGRDKNNHMETRYGAQSKRERFCQVRRYERIIMEEYKTEMNSFPEWNRSNALSKAEMYNYRYHSDPQFMLKARLRRRVRKLLGKYKTGATLDLIGCGLDFFRQHIQSTFKAGMNWNNYGSWHLDHIVPCESFDLTCPIQQKQCFHWSNYQALWKKANMMKSAKILPHQQLFAMTIKL